MQRIKFMYKYFLREPLWFKILIPFTLLVAIVFSSSYFSDNGNYQGVAKLAAAVFFCVVGLKFRRNRNLSIVFFTLVALCVYLSWQYFDQARS